MPELPDIEVYVEALAQRIAGRELRRVRLGNPFVLRSVVPAIADVEGRAVTGVSRLGKRIVLEFAGGPCAVLHLMIAGRLQWRAAGAKLPGRRGLAAFDFDDGSLLFTEAGTKKRASLHLVEDAGGLAAFDRGGLEVLDSDLAGFRAALVRENRTLKRALTDPRIFSGIGNAYSDEILHRARLSPFRTTRALDDPEIETLFGAVRDVLSEWTARLRAKAGDRFPEKVSAFHDEMAVHGRYRRPCPVCGAPVQRIVYAENEANYCAGCQTGGRLLADRALSRLLKGDWPRTLDDLER